MENELNKLLSKPISYYKKLIRKNNTKFDFKKPVILFGAGALGKELLYFFKNKGTQVIAFSDNDRSKTGRRYLGIKVINKNSIGNLFGKNVQIVASCTKYFVVIRDLASAGFTNAWNPMYFFTLYASYFDIFVWTNNIGDILKNKKNILSIYELLSDNESKMILLNIIKFRLLLDVRLLEHNVDKYEQYFNAEIVKLTKAEIFLDGGAYDGDTIQVFIGKTKNRFSKIYAFEPDKINFNKMRHNLYRHSVDKIEFRNIGVGERKRTLSFTSDGNVSSRMVSGDNGNKVTVVPFDAFRKPFTFIKLDIEGYEKNAILGARKTLKIFKPRLAICVYHHLEDLWEIPLLIKKINPTYKIFLRRYTSFLHETVCYAN